MIGTIGPNGIIIFDLNIQSPYDWIDLINSTFPNNNWHIGCAGGYENSWFLSCWMLNK